MPVKMRTLVVAPHPDDEVLGPGGTIFRRKAEGVEVAWLIVTDMSEELGWTPERVKQRENEIDQITKEFGFDAVYRLGFPAAKLDQVGMSQLVSAISTVFNEFEPTEIFVPHPSDIHSDHRIVFDAVASCTKWFRNPTVRRVLAYETLSETDFSLGAERAFRPNVFVDISRYLDDKLRVLDIYSSEVEEFPFPRSHLALRALASLRGAAAGYLAAEAFELLRERS